MSFLPIYRDTQKASDGRGQFMDYVASFLSDF